MAHSVFHTGYRITLNLSLDDLGHDIPGLWEELHGKCRPGLLLCLECLDADPGCPQWMYVQMRRGIRLACHYNTASTRHPSKPEGDRHRALKDRVATVASKAGFDAQTEVQTADQKRCTDVVVTGPNNTRIGFEIQFSHATHRVVRQRTVDARRVGLAPAWTTDTTTAPRIDRTPWTRIDRQTWQNLARPGNPLLIRGGVRELFRDMCHQSPLLCPRRWGGRCDGWHGTWQPRGRLQFDEFVLRAAAQEFVTLHLPAIGDDRKHNAYIWTTPADRQKYIDSGAPVVPDETDVASDQAAPVAPKPIDRACRWMERKDYVPGPAVHRDTGAVFGSTAGLGQLPDSRGASKAPEQRKPGNWDRRQTGPCVRCRQPTCRYGAGASPLCAQCRAAREV
ncbi:hypothetical protein AB0D83_19870 [Streptomyces decoyicus]|uniref:competence protein CoiA family protein n=1 Tax=Streptomyces decoyicus TaxID=249567 RepID=UPI0033C1A12D